MPELGEVARVVYYLRKHLLNRTISSITAYEDDIVYGKVGTSAEAFQSALTGRRVTGADQQGKYFYLTLDRKPHPVCHLGMTGWIRFDVEETGYYKQAKEKGKKAGQEGTNGEVEWPPKYMKFLLRCEAEGDKQAIEAAFVDARRLARIRLVDCPAEEIRQYSPLKENGPDPVRDKEIVTVDWLKQLLGRKKVPVKALLLDQRCLSGVGNWVADEIIFQARLHPEQYSNTFSDEQVQQLHSALLYVCTTAVETLADSTQFPETWLMKYRWDKGKKGANVLPSGEKIVHIKVGGRTSAIVPSLQKKTGTVAGDISDASGVEEKPKKKSKRRPKLPEGDEGEEGDEAVEEQKSQKDRKRKSRAAEDEVQDGGEETAPKKSSRRARKTIIQENGRDAEESDADATAGIKGTEEKVNASRRKKATPKKPIEKQATPGSRRSTRNKA